MHHVSLRVRDMERSLAFYRDILGFAPKTSFVLDEILEGSHDWRFTRGEEFPGARGSFTVVNDEPSTAILAGVCAFDLAPKIVYQHLVAIANAKNGLAHLEYLLVRFGRVLCVDACWAAGKYYPLWVCFLDYLGRRVVR